MKRFLSLIILTILFVSCGTQQKVAKSEGRSTGPDDPSGFVVLTDVVPDVILEIRYYSTFNFVGTRVDGYEEPIALSTREAAQAPKARLPLKTEALTALRTPPRCKARPGANVKAPS